MNPPARPGLYALLIEIPAKIEKRIGGLGVKEFTPGCYVYIGSAKGPGGLAARIGRHLSMRKKARWHIDYLLLGAAAIVAVVYAEEASRPECVLTPPLEARGFTHPVPRFGSSDCKMKCKSHLLECPWRDCNTCLKEAADAFRENGLTPQIMFIRK